MIKDALLILSAPLHPSIHPSNQPTIQTKLLDSHLALTLTFEMCLLLLLLVVAVRANRAVRCGNAPDERVSTQHGTSGVFLTDAERHWSVRVRAAQNTHCSTQTKPTSSHHCINVTHSCCSTRVVCVRSLFVLRASVVCNG